MAKFDRKLLLTPNLGARVLKMLSLLAPLPVSGFIAGQSVASAIDACLGTGVSPINDIDVFMGPADWAEFTGDSRAIRVIGAIGGSVSFTGAPNLAAAHTVDEYGSIMGVDPISQRSLYTVAKSRVDGLVNRVLVLFNRGQPCYGAGGDTSLYATDLISGFDLNNVQVAVSAQTGELFCTEAYLKYFEGRELRIIATVTPVQSYLRYLRKRQELKCFGDDAGHHSLIRQILARNRGSDAWELTRLRRFKAGKQLMSDSGYRYKDEQSESSAVGMGVALSTMSIGPKYLNLFTKFESELKGMVELTKHGQKNVWLASLTEKSIEIVKEANLRTLPRSGFHQVPRYWEIVSTPSKMTLQRRQLFDQFLADVGTEIAKHFNDTYCVIGDAYLFGIENAGPMAEIVSLIRVHHEVIPALSGLNFHMQSQLVRLARSTMKTLELSEAWGVFRTIKRGAGLTFVRSPELLVKEFALLKESAVPLIRDKLPLPSTMGMVAVQELISVIELRDEGRRMDHCVGGYGKAILNCQSRILSLRGGVSSDSCATVEWSWKTKGNPGECGLAPLAVDLQQIRSTGNSKPLDELLAVELELRECLNNWLMKNVERGWQLLRPSDYERHVTRRAAAAQTT